MRVVLCTCPPSEAEKIARHLVQEGAACVNILSNIRSIYTWKGEIQDDGEALLMIKAAAEKVAQLKEALEKVHPYDLPEWVVVDTDQELTSEAYRQWVRNPE